MKNQLKTKSGLRQTGKPKILAIVGPTASGKSDLAVKLAKQFSGEVISADSRQVYRGLDIGSGKITQREMEGVRHHLLDVADPKKVFSVDQYKNLAEQAVSEILSRGHLPIFCGGTGLYLEAVIFNQSFPAVPPDQKLRTKLSKLNADQLFKRLKKVDPKRAKTIEAKNPVRLIRALEIVASLGQVPKRQTNVSPYDCLWLGINPPSEELKGKISIRLKARLKKGLVAEVKRLQEKGLSWKRLEALGLEYRYVALYLQNKIDKTEMVGELTQTINHYAKRQLTWFRHIKDIHWLEKPNQSQKLVKNWLKN